MPATAAKRAVEVKAPAAPESAAARFLRSFIGESGISCEFGLPSGEVLRFGSEAPRFRVIFRTERALRQLFDETASGEAYVNGEIDIDGDMIGALDLRFLMKDRMKLSRLMRFWVDLFVRSKTKVNKNAIAEHYNYGDDLFLTFIDTKYRIYSHGQFHSDADTLEQVSEHKLETMYRALELQPGMRLLDIGGGWGGVTQYCGSRGVHVTSLTIANDSYHYIRNLIESNRYPGEVLLQDFLEHRPQRPYDAVVIYGVIEHIPYYRRFFTRLWDCLQPNGLLYLDASATVEKFDVSSFNRRYIWKGPHTFLCLQDLIRELLYHGLHLLRVVDETRDYELTMAQWARRLEANKEKIIARWGEPLYRAFRLYLWGGSHTLRHHVLQAYHLVARRGLTPGPRPGLLRRTRQFIEGLT